MSASRHYRHHHHNQHHNQHRWTCRPTSFVVSLQLLLMCSGMLSSSVTFVQSFAVAAGVRRYRHSRTAGGKTIISQLYLNSATVVVDAAAAAAAAAAVRVQQPQHPSRRHQQQQQLFLRQERRGGSLCRRLYATNSDDDKNNNGNDNNVEGDSSQRNKKKARIVFLGTPDVAATSLQTLVEASRGGGEKPELHDLYDIVAVVTQPPKRRKRKGKLEASPVGQAAEALGIDTILTPEKANEAAFLDTLTHDVQPDLCITAAYGQYLPKRFLATPRLGTVNIHPSLLPRWRGASPVQRSLEAGDNPVGVTVLYTVSKMDAGPIIAQTACQINDENDTTTTVLPRLFAMGTQLLLEKLPDLLNETISLQEHKGVIPQDEAAAVSAPLIQPNEAEFKVWQESARTCHNRLRGFSLWPGAYMYLTVGDDSPSNIMKVKITETRVVSDGPTASASPTTAATATTTNVPFFADLVEPRTSSSSTTTTTTTTTTKEADHKTNNVITLGPTKKDGLYVTCFDGSILELIRVQPATRKAFPARDFQNGYPGQTIRWVRTPKDQDANPEKYNSRGSGSSTSGSSGSKNAAAVKAQ